MIFVYILLLQHNVPNFVYILFWMEYFFVKGLDDHTIFCL